MIQKFVTVPVCRAVSVVMLLATVLAGASRLSAQQTPAQTPSDSSAQTQSDSTQSEPQTAPAQPAPAPSAPVQQPQAGQQPSAQSGGQEPSDEELGQRRKVKVHDYKNWNFNAGGGASLTNGTTKDFVRGGGGVGAVGVARNTNKYFGFRVDFQFDDLPLRNSALKLAQAPSATSYVFSFMFDPIINVPVNKLWSGYIVFGPSYYHRGGTLDSSTEIPGSACNGFWTWWGVCSAGTVPLSGKFRSASQDEVGYNLGAGVARKIRPNLEIYGEFRYLHGTHAGITTDLRPITVGVRW
jgi:opacity protein-like surface antigen